MGYDGNIMLVKVKFEVGVVGNMYKYYYLQVIYVESGEFEMIIGDDVRIIKGGDFFYIFLYVMYGCVCKQFGILIDVFSFVREDFLGYEMLDC